MSAASHMAKVSSAALFKGHQSCTIHGPNMKQDSSLSSFIFPSVSQLKGLILLSPVARTELRAHTASGSLMTGLKQDIDVIPI